MDVRRLVSERKTLDDAVQIRSELFEVHVIGPSCDMENHVIGQDDDYLLPHCYLKLRGKSIFVTESIFSVHLDLLFTDFIKVGRVFVL